MPKKGSEETYTLDRLRPGRSGTVTKIDCDGALKQRLVDMGITPGVTLTVVKTAPMGDPIQIHLRGYELSVRKGDARRIFVQQAPGKADRKIVS